MPTMASEFPDLVAFTLSDYDKKKPKYKQIAQTYVNYEVVDKWFKKDKIIISGGKNITRNLMVRTLGAARHRGFLEDDQAQLGDVGQQLTVEWCYADTSYAFHKITDLKMNTGDKELADTVKMKRDSAFIDIAEVLEPAGWSAPADADDTTEPYGIPYYVPKASGTPGFSTTLAFGTTCAGVNPTTYSGWRHYGGTYAAITYDDWSVPMQIAHFKTGFKSPLGVTETARDPAMRRWRIYTNIASLVEVEKVARYQNDNLGPDLAKYRGMSVFKGHPMIAVDYLTADTDNPFYFIDHDTFMPVVLKGCFFVETVSGDPNNRNIARVFVDLVYNYLCIDRRRNGVLYAA